LVRKRLDLKLIKEFNHFGAHFLLNHIEIGAILLQLLDDFVLVWEVLLFDEFRPGHIPLNLTKLALKRLNDISILISNFITRWFINMIAVISAMIILFSVYWLLVHLLLARGIRDERSLLLLQLGLRLLLNLPFHGVLVPI